MRADEWRRAIENEAASVEDQGWAREARRAAWRLGWPRAAGVSAGVYAALGCTQVVALTFWPQLWPPAQAWPDLWTATLLAVGTVALGLGWRGFPAWTVGVGAVAFLPAAWTAVVLLQVLWPAQAPTTPGFSDDGLRTAVLVVIALNAAGATHSLRHFRRVHA